MRLTAVALTCAGVVAAARSVAAQGRIVDDSIRSPALEGNRLRDSPVRSLRMYLPASYDNGAEPRYPVLYLLHGFGGSPSSWSDGTYRGFQLERVMDSLIASGVVREFIIAMIDGHNTYGGSVFTNSATSGDWETYLIRDAVRHVDGRYRTLRRAASRGIAGHSMGAAAALRIAMRYPNGFGVVYAMSPNAGLPCQSPSRETQDRLLAMKSLRSVEELDFEGQLCLGYSAAWSPDSSRPPTYVALPFTREGSQTVADTAVLERWRSWMLLEMAPRYREGLVRLRGIGLDVGTEDGLHPGVRQLDSLLTRLRVRHQFERYRGNHSSGIGQRLTTRVLPFFSASFDFGPAEP